MRPSSVTLLGGVNVPDNVAGQADDLVSGPLGHPREALGLGLVLEGVAGEVDAWRSSQHQSFRSRENVVETLPKR